MASKKQASELAKSIALEAAATETLNRSLVIIPARDWDQFETWINAPAKDIPAIRNLATRKPILQN